jgi:hypothetical protein
MAACPTMPSAAPHQQSYTDSRSHRRTPVAQHAHVQLAPTTPETRATVRHIHYTSSSQFIDDLYRSLCHYQLHGWVCFECCHSTISLHMQATEENIPAKHTKSASTSIRNCTACTQQCHSVCASTPAMCNYHHSSGPLITQPTRTHLTAQTGPACFSPVLQAAHC